MNLEEMKAKAERLRLGPEGRAQRDKLFGILTHAIISIEAIQPPWLDDYIENSRQELLSIRATIPKD